MATDGYGSPIPNSVAKVHISSQSPNKISKNVLNTSSIETVKTYYKTLINEEASYVVVRADGSDIIFHAIQDADHFKEEKIQNPWEKRWISFVPEVGLHSQGFLLQRYTFLPNLQTKSQKNVLNTSSIETVKTKWPSNQ